MQQVALDVGRDVGAELRATAGAVVLRVVVRAYGTQRGGLAEHIEEAIESALRNENAGAPGIAFDVDPDARLSDQLFRARRAGFTSIVIQLTALRALCAPVGGIDAADAHAIAFYTRAMEDRPVVLVVDEAARSLPAFIVAKPLRELLDGAPANKTISEPEPEAASISLAKVVAMDVDADETHEADEPFDPTNGQWRGYVDTLDAARGPQTLAAFERLFVQSYLPLATALDQGLEHPHATAAREEFRRTFARAYTEALPTFALTGKRPRMVLDAFDLAAKMGRSHGARGAHVLLVDGMRFDLAARVSARLAELLEGRAALADRVTLFSALPSTTPRQAETLARGVDALRQASERDADREAEPLRGRTADTVRRVRVGSRDLYKLDLVETTLASAGTGAIDIIDDLVEDTARAIAKHARVQSSRTLLFIFGDHGFRFQEGAATHGGASPEEVIVSAHAFLIGDLH
jgi:hypothetical protein